MLSAKARVKYLVGGIGLIFLLGALVWIYRQSRTAETPIGQTHNSTPTASGQSVDHDAPSTSSLEKMRKHAPLEKRSGLTFGRMTYSDEKKSADIYRIDFLPAEFLSLAEKAEKGDLKAALTLFRALKDCRNDQLPKSQADLDRQIADINTPGNPIVRNDAARLQMIATRQELFRQCHPLSEAQWASFAHWRDIMAAAGDIDAIGEYVMNGAPRDALSPNVREEEAEYRARARELLGQAIDRGEPLAMYWRSESLRNNILGDIDPIGAYQYYYAFMLVTGHTQEVYAHHLLVLERELTPAQILQAQRRGEGLADRCCKP